MCSRKVRKKGERGNLSHWFFESCYKPEPGNLSFKPFFLALLCRASVFIFRKLGTMNRFQLFKSVFIFQLHRRSNKNRSNLKRFPFQSGKLSSHTFQETSLSMWSDEQNRLSRSLESVWIISQRRPFVNLPSPVCEFPIWIAFKNYRVSEAVQFMNFNNFLMRNNSNNNGNWFEFF